MAAQRRPAGALTSRFSAVVVPVLFEVKGNVSAGEEGEEGEGEGY